MLLRIVTPQKLLRKLRLISSPAADSKKMTEEKEDSETVKLKNKDVSGFQSGIGYARFFGIKNVDLIRKELLLVDKTNSMTAYIWKEMPMQDRTLLASSVGKIINILRYQDIDGGARKFMIIKSFKIIEQKFEPQNNYEHLDHKMMGFKAAADVHNLQQDVDNIKFGSSMMRICCSLYVFHNHTENKWI